MIGPGLGSSEAAGGSCCSPRSSADDPPLVSDADACNVLASIPDLFRDFHAAAMDRSPVVIVYLDLTSFLAEKQDPVRPRPRELHARLVRRLVEAGARAVVFDVVFGGPGPDAEADARFAEAIRESGRVILAGQAERGRRPCAGSASALGPLAGGRATPRGSRSGVGGRRLGGGNHPGRRRLRGAPASGRGGLPSRSPR